MGDSDGNGREEVILQNYLGGTQCETRFLEWGHGNSFQLKMNLPLECSKPAFDAGNIGNLLTDLNGDGLQDLLTSTFAVPGVWNSGYRWSARLNTSAGYGPPHATPIQGGTMIGLLPYSTSAIDYDGDGRTELLGYSEENPNVGDFNRPAVYGLKDDNNYGEIAASTSGWGPLPPNRLAGDVFHGDYNGDGLRDVLWINYVVADGRSTCTSTVR